MKKILAFILVLVMIVSFASCKKKADPVVEEQITPPTPELPGVDMFNEDLSDYIEIDDKYYKGLTIEVLVNTVTDEDIEKVIASVLRENRVQSEMGDEAIAEGDEVHVFYKGYLLEGEEKNYFEGGSNVGGKAYALEIGSGAFIPGFESNMIGKIPAEYSESNPMIIEATFPENYPQSPDLAGKVAYFEVTVEVADEKYNVYKLPELTDGFVTETLGFTEEQLAVYDGETTVDKYLAHIRETLEWQGVDINDFAERVFRQSAMAGAVIKKYPEKQFKEFCDNKIKTLENNYNKFSLSFLYTFDQYVCTCYEIPYGSDWRAEIEKEAEIAIKYNLILYHVMNLEGVKPSEEEYSKLLSDYLASELEKNGITPDVFNKIEEYEAQKEQYRAKMTLEYGANYFREKIYKALIYDMVISYANIVEITE